MAGANTKYFRVSPKFWADSRSWDESTRHLALYILTSPHRTTEGLFRLPGVYMLDDLQWTQRRLNKHFGVLQDLAFVDYEADVMLILKALSYQPPANDNVVLHALNHLEMVPPTRLDLLFGQLAQRYSERLAKGLGERFGERFGKPLSLTPTPAPSRSQSTPPTPQDKPGGRTAPRHEGTNPRAIAKEQRRQSAIEAMSHCSDCSDKPWNCLNCERRLREATA